MATTDPIRRVRAHLSTALAHESASVSTELPANASERLPIVVVSATGGVEDDFLDRPQILLDCHAATDMEAYDLARTAADRMRAMADLDPWVSDVGTGTPYRNDWTRATTPPGHCYSVTCDLTINK